MFPVQLRAYRIPFWVITNVRHIVSLGLGVRHDVSSDILDPIDQLFTSRFGVSESKPNCKSFISSVKI